MDNRKTLIDQSTGKLSWVTRVAYASGDVACNIVFGVISILTLFYTDYAGINPALVGLVMLLARAFDGFSDIIMGFIVEKTHSKWGKSRPWILWMSVPFALSAVLLFAVPQSTETVQFIYMFVTYNFCTTICYTALNLPYGSLSTMMTRVSVERDMLSVVRMGLAPLGKIFAVSCTLPLIKIMGNDQTAWIKVMSIWAVLALILLLFCFFKCEEKVEIKAREKKVKVPFKKALGAVIHNQYFWAVFMLWMMQNVIQTVPATMLPYYCKYIFGNDSWLYSTLYFMEIAILIVATLGCPALLKRFGKRNMSLAGACVALAGQLLFFLNPRSLPWLVMSCVIRALGMAPLNSVVFGMVGDVVEFGQWKTHLRQEGLIFACGSLGTKIGGGVSTALMTGLLSFAGYISSTGNFVNQPESAIKMIIDIYKFGPVIIWILVIITLTLYKLDKIYPSIMDQLAEREARGEL